MIPWNVRFALAAYDAGWTLPSWLLMSVQMVRNGEGCGCAPRATARELNEQMT